MNRRDLIRRGPLALFGIGVAILGVKAKSDKDKEMRFVLNVDSRAFRDTVMKTATEDARAYRPFLTDVRSGEVPPTRPLSREEIEERFNAALR